MQRTKTTRPKRQSNSTATSGLMVAIAKLLSDHDLREQFENDPNQVAEQLNVAPADRTEFVALDPEQLHRRSATLLNKRWHEVCRLVPLTIEYLGDGASEVFRSYATNDWPVGHRRYPDDAFRFVQFLIANQIQNPNKSELKRMRRLSSQMQNR